MKIYYRRKILIIIALVVAVLGLGVGFAAFSTSLNISSSASVAPSSSDFDIRFCEESDGSKCDWESDLFAYPVASNGAEGNIGNLFYHNVSYLSVTFSKPNQSVLYKFYVHNLGEYDAYLKDVSYTALSNGTYKMCSATTTDSTKATDSLVQAACDGINVTVSIGGTSYSFGSNISGHKLSKESVEEVLFTIEYADGSALADGPFKVDISDFKLNYSTVDNNINLISFVIGGATYQAEEGMTLAEWVNSSYNTGNFTINSEFCNSASSNWAVDNYNTVIVDGVTYSYKCK